MGGPMAIDLTPVLRADLQTAFEDDVFFTEREWADSGLPGGLKYFWNRGGRQAVSDFLEEAKTKYPQWIFSPSMLSALRKDFFKEEITEDKNSRALIGELEQRQADAVKAYEAAKREIPAGVLSGAAWKKLKSDVLTEKGLPGFLLFLTEKIKALQEGTDFTMSARAIWEMEKFASGREIGEAILGSKKISPEYTDVTDVILLQKAQENLAYVEGVIGDPPAEDLIARAGDTLLFVQRFAESQDLLAELSRRHPPAFGPMPNGVAQIRAMEAKMRGLRSGVVERFKSCFSLLHVEAERRHAEQTKTGRTEDADAAVTAYAKLVKLLRVASASIEVDVPHFALKSVQILLGYGKLLHSLQKPARALIKYGEAMGLLPVLKAANPVLASEYMWEIHYARALAYEARWMEKEDKNDLQNAQGELTTIQKDQEFSKWREKQKPPHWAFSVGVKFKEWENTLKGALPVPAESPAVAVAPSPASPREKPRLGFRLEVGGQLGYLRTYANGTYHGKGVGVDNAVVGAAARPCLAVRPFPQSRPEEEITLCLSAGLMAAGTFENHHIGMLPVGLHARYPVPVPFLKGSRADVEVVGGVAVPLWKSGLPTAYAEYDFDPTRPLATVGLRIFPFSGAKASWLQKKEYAWLRGLFLAGDLAFSSVETDGVGRNINAGGGVGYQRVVVKR